MHVYDYFSETLPGIDPFSPFCPPSPYSKQSAGLLLFHLVIRTAAGSPDAFHVQNNTLALHLLLTNMYLSCEVHRVMQEDRNIKNIALFGDREADAGSWLHIVLGSETTNYQLAIYLRKILLRYLL